MKNFLTLTLAMFLSIAVFAQSPQAVCYQAVATDAAGIELQARDISVRATLFQGTINGAVVTQEIYSVTTDDFGLFNLEIGQGNAVAGTALFVDVDWAQGPFFLGMEMDPTGGTDFVFLGKSQIVSVPYALYSEKSGSAQNAVNAQNATNATYADTSFVALTSLSAANDADTSATNEIQFLQYDENTGILNLTGSNEPGVSISSFDGDTDPDNELQNLEYDAATGVLALTNSTGAPITINTNDADADPLNEIQNLEYNPTTSVLSLTNTVGAGVLIETNDADSNPENELQNLQYNETTGALSLTGVTAQEIIINTDDADADPNNELQQLSLEGNVLTISGAGGNAIDFGEELFGAPGASMDFPQGIVGQHLVLKMGTFTVPEGKTFYLTASGNTVSFLTPNGNTVVHPTTPNMPVFAPNTIITNCRCTGMLINSNENIVPEVLDLTVPTEMYTVPPGFILFLKSGISNSMTGSLKIDGDNMEFLRPNFTRGSRIISFPEGTDIQRPTNSDPGAFVLTGYLIAIPN